MTNPKVSIITSSYNRGDIIGETAASIFEQEYDNWDWCIVDDHSTNDTFEVIQKIAEGNNRISCFQRTGDKRGANVCRNQGADSTDGEYLLFLDDDDLLTPFALKQRVHSLVSNPELDFGLFPSLLFHKEPYDMNVRWNIDKPISDITRQLNRDPVCQAGGLLITRDAFNRFGKFDTSLLLWQDIDLFFRLFIQGMKYEKFFDLEPDLHIRHALNSLSRGDFYNRGKLMSRLRVVETVIHTLEEANKGNYLKDVDSMLVDVYVSLLAARHTKEANRLLKLGIESNVLNESEKRPMNQLKFIYDFKLYKFPFGKKKISSILNAYLRENTVGQIAFK